MTELSGSSTNHPRWQVSLAPTNLPIPFTSFVGQKRALQQIREKLSSSRLLTIIGPGGVGKTRLSLEVASSMPDEFEHGIWLVKLAAISDPRLVVLEVWRTFRLHEGSDPIGFNQLGNILANLSCLLILDNCEHLLSACTELVEALLRSGPNIRILATSREPLGIVGETAWTVPLLSLPDPEQPLLIENLLKSEAVQLFLDRARNVNPDFQISETSAAAIAAISQRLEGVPLAIEMAAAWVRILTPLQIADRLAEPFQLLTKGNRTASPRQQTLEASIDWSYQLLSEAEKILFRRLAIFVGDFTLESVEAICPDEDTLEEISGEVVINGIDPPEITHLRKDQIVHLLSNLVDKSLILVHQEPEIHFSMLKVIRHSAWNKLLASAELELLQFQFVNFYADMADQDESFQSGSERSAWLWRMHLEKDNWRRAVQWALDRKDIDRGLRLANTMGWFWSFQGYLTEGRRWLEIMLSQEGKNSPGRALALVNIANLAIGMGDHTDALAYAKQGLAMGRVFHDVQVEAYAIMVLGQIANWQGNRDVGADYLEKSLALFLDIGAKRYLAKNLLLLADTYFRTGNHSKAAELYQQGLERNQELGDDVGTAFALGGLGDIARIKGDLISAADLFHQSLMIAVKEVYKEHLVFNLEAQGILAAEMGLYHRAAQLWGFADQTRDKINLPLSFSYQNDYGQFIQIARNSLGRDNFESAWEKGRRLSFQDALQLTFRAADSSVEDFSEIGRTIPEPLLQNTEELVKPLTRREIEILELIAKGLSNREIAERLVLSQGTVKWYTGQIYAKLGVQTRTQSINRARQLGLIH